MPALLPPPMPLFSCSITRASGKRSRTKSTVPSFDPLSTTTTSCPRTDSRHRSSHGNASNVTTTTETSATRRRYRGAAVEDVLPEDHAEAGQREQDGHDEEEETAGEGGVGVHAEVAEEADEERLAHADAVDREGHEHDEEEQRAEHDVRQQPELDADRLGGGIDRDHARELQHERCGRDEQQRARGVAVAVDAVVDRARRLLDAEAAGEQHQEREPPSCGVREEDDPGGDRQHDEDRLRPQVGTDRVAADREQEADAGEKERDGAAERALDEHGARDRRQLAEVPP